MDREDHPASQLVGQVLNNRWEVLRRYDRADNATGGTFSIGYEVQDQAGNRAFLKAFDVAYALESGMDMAQAQSDLLAAYMFERDILLKCRRRNLDRVVMAIDEGITFAPNFRFVQIPFLIFEQADGDIRKQVTVAGHFDVAWILRCLHHVATGIQQLHTDGVAHQDLKPSNILVFNERVSKIGDLGRAVAHGFTPPHQDNPIPGDRGYAAPEFLYGEIDSDWNRRRLASDIYHFGSLIMFFFVGTAMTPMISQELNPSHLWRSPWKNGGWTGSYVAVLPYVREAFDKSMEKFTVSLEQRNLGTKLIQELKALTYSLCDPDPALRGHPNQVIGNRYSMQRYVSQFDRMALEAEMRLKKVISS